MTVDEIKKLKVARVKCDNSLMFFTRYFFMKLKNQKFITNWHHKELCSQFEKVSNYETIFLNINQPPRTSKTELAVNFVAQNLGKNPHGNYLYITASDDLRSEFSVKIRDIITSEEYKKMYGVELKKDQNAKNLWRTEQGGGLKTATIFGQITGFGAGQMVDHTKDLEDYIRDFEGSIILDDINKIGDAEASNANNTKAINRIFDTILSRTNSFDTPLINIQQRSGVEDATAALMEYYKGKEKVSNAVLPIMDKDGNSLWEWKYPLSEIENLRTHERTAHIFRTQYMQDPVDIEGLLFPRQEMKRFRMADLNIENCLGKLSFIDTADKGTDYYSAPVGCMFPNENAYDLYLTNVIYTKKPFEITKPLQIETINELEIDYTLVESNKEGTLYVNNLKEGCPKYTIKGKPTHGNKETRILVEGEYIKNIYFLEDEDQDEMYRAYFNGLTTYKKEGGNKNDDAADSTAGLSKLSRIKFKPQKPKEKSWQKQL